MKTLTLKYDQFMGDAEFNRFGIMAMCILGNTIIGSITCYSVMSRFGTLLPLIICTSATIIPNTFSLAVAPMKQIVWGNFIGISVNLILLLVSLLA